MKSIVLLEDDAALADMYKTNLELEEFECLVASDGITGLELIKTKLPDLVLLDLMLPGMSGVDILAQMRESDWGKDIKVMIMTNISQSDSPQKLMNYKFERYIVKANTSLDQVTDIIKDILRELPEDATLAANPTV